ncbi:MAG: cytochrome c [Candidatus Sericytochromatia bacterium]|nr:cytochrome c [Candidatus Sericytochromatia bacterium]
MSLRPAALAAFGLALFGASVYGLTLALRPPATAGHAATSPPPGAASAGPASVSPASTAGPEARTSPAPLAVLGEALYRRECQACHGLGGEGGMGPALRGRRDAGVIRRAITLGRPANGMPALGNRLTSGEVEAVTAYVRTL